MNKYTMWDYGINEYLYRLSSNRLITTEEIDYELSRSIEKEKYIHIFQKMKTYFDKKINKSYEKFVLYVLKDIMLKEMKKPYYTNGVHILKFIDIDSHMVFNDDGSCYEHIENLCIWKNGFYQFNSFNMTKSMMGYAKSNNFNEEIAQELEEFDCHGKLVSIDSKDRGTKEDYAKLEAKILKMSKQHESYTE